MDIKPNKYVLVKGDYGFNGIVSCVGKITGYTGTNKSLIHIKVIEVLSDNTCEWSNKIDKTVFLPFSDILYDADTVSDLKSKCPEYFI